MKYKLYGQLDKSYTDVILPEHSQLIKDRLLDECPLMISRFGSTELNCLVNFVNLNQEKGKVLRFITGKTKYYKWNRHTIESMNTLSGFFPSTIDNLIRFSELIYQDMQQIDILGSWLQEEAVFAEELKASIKIGFLNLEPFNHIDPWTSGLEHKKVLVIHPFAESIRKQYRKRELLFANQRVLPEFELITLKAVQSIAGNPTRFEDWFQALDFMMNEITRFDFDVAIIGCGAYGMPLAAFIKRLGKKAVHLGGATQLLFGITGKRWENQGYSYKDRFVNEYWVRPQISETPQNSNKVEEGCYW